MDGGCLEEDFPLHQASQTVLMMIDAPVQGDSDCSSSSCKPPSRCNTRHKQCSGDYQVNKRSFHTPKQSRKLHHFSTDHPEEFRPRAASEKLPCFYRRQQGPVEALQSTQLAAPRPRFCSENHLQLHKPDIVHNHQTNITDTLAGVAPSARKNTPKYHPSMSLYQGQQDAHKHCGCAGRARTRSDTHLQRKYHDCWYKDWRLTEESTALLGSSSTSSSGTEDEFTNSAHALIPGGNSRDSLEQRLISAERGHSASFTANSKISSSCTNNSHASSTGNSNRTKNIETSDMKLGLHQLNPTKEHEKMDYLKVPTAWKSQGSVSHPSERRHSTRSQYDQQHQPNEPLLRPGHEEHLLRRRKRRSGYFLTAKTTIWLSTRVVFMLLLLVGTGVIVTSIWFMLQCKTGFQAVRPLLPNNSNFCRTMGMPALFAGCTVLFSICGLACTGRKFTGYALIVISSVEILQSVTTLTFYNCRVLSAGSVLASVNDSLLKCHATVGQPSTNQPRLAQIQLAGNRAGYTPGEFADLPFHLRTSKMSAYSTSTPAIQQKRLHKTKSGAQSRSDNHYVTRKLTGLEKDARQGSIAVMDDKDSDRFFQGNRKQRRATGVKGVKNLNKRADVSSFRDGKKQSMSGFTDFNVGLDISMLRNFVGGENSFHYQVDCSADSQFFQLLSQTGSQETYQKCTSVCQTYQAVCENSLQNPFDEQELLDHYGLHHGKRSESTSGSHGSRSTQYAHIPNSAHLSQDKARGVNDLQEYQESKRRGGHGDFQLAVQQCGRRVEWRVRNLCYYDNQVVLPMSLCAPVVYILLSCCFIYLARCEQARKERTRYTKIIPSASKTSANTTSLMGLPSSTQRSRAGSTFSCSSSDSENLKLSRIFSRLRRCWARSPWVRHKSLDRKSQSSHELLRLHTVMYSISTIVGLTMIESDVPAEAV
ncbi:hypothetical protein ElyMa_006424400 [Elysia marginata]|uniref:Tetraspanin n=1 Tax=Elysia marginata TaxID=1093978 RepID=A0AAV4HUX6_9GAST|nr:hypothetical protein ElyMa_006424400 [Elysia marginata]